MQARHSDPLERGSSFTSNRGNLRVPTSLRNALDAVLSKQRQPKYHVEDV